MRVICKKTYYFPLGSVFSDHVVFYGDYCMSRHVSTQMKCCSYLYHLGMLPTTQIGQLSLLLSARKEDQCRRHTVVRK